MEQTPTIENFYREHARAVYAFCVSLSRDPVWAEDLMQDTFARATRSLGGYRGGDPKSWLFAIARSVFIDDVRKKRPLPTDEVDTASSTDPDVTEIDAISGALAALPERQRTALLLADHAGLPHSEIAEALGATPGAVKVLVHRARINFRKSYEGTEPMKHEDIQDLLEDYVDDRLDRPARKLVDDHLKGCAECREILDEVAPVDISAFGTSDYDERVMRRTVRRSLFRTAWNAVLLVISGWLAIWFLAALVFQPLVVNRDGRAADFARASIDLGVMLNPGVVLTEGAISSGLFSRQVDLDFAVPVGGSLQPAFSDSTTISLFGVRDRPGISQSSNYGQFQGDALEQLSNLGDSTVATVALWFDSPVTMDEAQAIVDDPDFNFRVVWAGFDASLGRVAPFEPPVWTAGGTVGYATCHLPGNELGNDILGATSASFGHGSGFLFGRSSIEAARTSAVAALANIASRDELVDYVVEPYDDDRNDVSEVLGELRVDPEVTVLVVTGPSLAIAEYLESEPGVSANLLAVDFYNWTDEICGR